MRKTKHLSALLMFGATNAMRACGSSKNTTSPSKPSANEDFVYPDAMKNSGVVWKEDALDAFIGKPTNYIKGTKMCL